ncbi:MAG: hypothetical protein ABI970_04365 [Chloroflexota bacterium]
MSSDLTEFMSQGFMRAMLPLICVIGLLLIATIAAIAYSRWRKAQQALNKPTSPSFVSANDYAFSNHDMPDLNLLMHTPTAPPTPSPMPVKPAPEVIAPAPIRSARKGTFTVVPKDGGSTEAVEVMTILRDVVDGKLIVQMGEKSYYNINTDTEFKERFGKLMREVGQLVGKIAPASVEAVQPITTDEPEIDSAPLPSVSDLMQSNEPVFLAPKKPPVTPPAVMGGKLPGDLPSFKLDDNPLQKLKRGQKADLPPVPEINIAGAIEAYLQHKISLTPDYTGRSIHIYPAPGGGVSIEVDGKYFEAVSDVSDPAVREFLSDTIAEWQDRH